MHDIHFQVLPYADCAREVLEFRNANRDVARDQAYFEWRYVRRPCRQRAMVVWATDGAGRQVAAASVIPHDFYFLDGVYPLGVLGDISVAPAFRGRGIATRLLGFLRQEPAFGALRACVVLPNEEVSGALQRCGWRDATAVVRLVKIIAIAPRLEASLGRWATVAGIPRAFDHLARYASLEGWVARCSSPYRAVEARQFDAGFDDLWNLVPKQGRVLAVRNRQYLQWRYGEHPLVPYRIFEIRREDRLRAYAVFHVTAEAVEIDDFLAADAAAGFWLVRELLAHVRRERLAANVHARYNISGFLAVPWRRFGFFPRRDSHRVMLGFPGHGAPGAFPPQASWFVTAGDKDV
jgi:GNAT superfamily N-acetyltransferase